MLRVSALYRFPVKGLPAQRLESGHVRVGSGFDGDRAAALSNGRATVQPGNWDACRNFTVLKNDTSLQQWGVTSRVRPPRQAAAPGDVGDSGTAIATASDIELRAPDGARTLLATDDPASITAAGNFLTARLPSQGEHRREVVVADQGMFDSRHSGVSIINPATIAMLGRAGGIEDLDPLRFRGNVLIDGLEPWAEFGLIGTTVRIGGTRLWIRSSIERCPATKVNPVTTAVDVNVPQLLAAHFGHVHCGIYGVVLDDGDIRAGDEVVVDAGTPSPAPPASLDPALRKSVTSPRMMELIGMQLLDDAIVHIRLRDRLRGAADHYAPGMHVRVHLIDESSGHPLPLWRTYTLTAVTRTDHGDELEVMVGLDGKGSRSLAGMRAGSQVLVSGPFGRITDSRLGAHTAVLTAGIGITPAIALARNAARSTQPATYRFFHVERSTEATQAYSTLASAAHTPVAQQAGTSVQRWSTRTSGRPDETSVARALAAFAADAPLSDVVICGPPAFSAMCRTAAEDFGIPNQRVHSEVFASPLQPDSAPADLTPAVITVAGGAGHRETSVRWQPGDGFVLDSLAAAGIDAPWSCRGGSCGTCALGLRAGSLVYPVEPAAAVSADEVLSCCSYPDGDLTVELR